MRIASGPQVYRMSSRRDGVLTRVAIAGVETVRAYFIDCGARKTGGQPPKLRLLVAHGLTIRSKEDSSAVSLRHARETGEAEANAADLRLLLEESLAREEAWMTKALQAQKEIEEVRLSEQQLSLWRALKLEEQLENARAESAHLRADHDRLVGEVAWLTDYRRAVEGSKAWRLIQFLRGLAGRKW